jgi:DNA-binding NarL/FixJ family response regulator
MGRGTQPSSQELGVLRTDAQELGVARADAQELDATRRKRTRDEIRLLLADDDPRALRMVSDRLATDDVRVVGQARTGDEAVAMALELAPDILVMDLVMRGRDAIAATRQLATEAPETKVVILSITSDPEAILLALQAGAVGFLDKGIDIDALLRTVRGVYRGEAALDRLTTRTLIREFRAMSGRSQGHDAPATRPRASLENVRANIEAIVRSWRAARKERLRR